MANEKTRPDPSDGLKAMIVGKWAQEKHERLSAYIGASRRARAKFGYSSYIDLFCGPGRVVERHTDTFRDGGALLAWKSSVIGKAPFSRVFVSDLDAESVQSCKARLEALSAPVTTAVGPASTTVDAIISKLPSGLHLAFLDPFNAEHLDFSIIKKLAKQPHIDILVHFSVMDIQRNIDLEAANNGSRLDAIAPGWRNRIDLTKLPRKDFVTAFSDYWQSLVSDLANMKTANAKPLIVNSNNGPLYRLMLLHRHKLAGSLWDDVGREHKGQSDLFD
ncbi:three-Cys-motif partner protein TcmP [Paraburkholderia sediminicola]|uniref:three-Cys-motif partner protein TcmP n=1 Tax=Paraburkholderia sediminicola TaxID=458836 RepID=UPI0038B8B269